MADSGRGHWQRSGQPGLVLMVSLIGTRSDGQKHQPRVDRTFRHAGGTHRKAGKA